MSIRVMAAAVATAAGLAIATCGPADAVGFKLGLKLVFTLAGPDVFMTGNVGVFTAPPASPAPRTTMLRLIKRVRAAR